MSDVELLKLAAAELLECVRLGRRTRRSGNLLKVLGLIIVIMSDNLMKNIM